MSNSKRNNRSRLLSYVLRHNPDDIDLSLDTQGWADVSELLNRLALRGDTVSFDELVQLVETNNKQRFAFNADRTKIRASQGHSIDVELGYAPQVPPEFLYHGTVDRFLEDIRQLGLTKQKRHHVHLSPDRETAAIVGARRGKPVILKVAAGEMHGDGVAFFCSENGVWLTETVPVSYIEFP